MAKMGKVVEKGVDPTCLCDFCGWHISLEVFHLLQSGEGFSSYKQFYRSLFYYLEKTNYLRVEL